MPPQRLVVAVRRQLTQLQPAHEDNRVVQEVSPVELTNFIAAKDLGRVGHVHARRLHDAAHQVHFRRPPYL